MHNKMYFCYYLNRRKQISIRGNLRKKKLIERLGVNLVKRTENSNPLNKINLFSHVT